ncbi:eukaryotic and archaeal DNA primase small subunit [Radiomyces spectabilis]|uniref:eukaryotic and archaeal DNA primase small subunit n=1 Tax=Radiomyces spectabilis TaxID=64574 RepID=UPI0022200CDC|nr:eukaryotic and archaeal DNA primase small subunit [Radiomyces spectabilis]KAI8393421.1 eukaryotic and archaeal DNA primase small subunit [Radiomyces spectabilis]
MAATDPLQLHEELRDMAAEDIFKDDDEDMLDHVDNRFASVQLQTPVHQTIARSQMDEPMDFTSRDEDPIFLLRMFYERFFPYKTYFQWLNYDLVPTKNFINREFSFTLASDIYIRYNSFADVNHLRKEIERLQPVKMDIGAVYTVKPKDKKTVSEKAFRPLEKELVFDIDMTDYDEIRTCCSGGDICEKCWQFMTIAIKVIDAALREDFGFEHLLWVYSGRRGVHCWVSDERARKLDNTSRKAIVSYLEVIKGGADSARKVKLPSVMHTSLRRSLDIIKSYFVPLLLEKQGILETQESWSKVLAILPDADMRNTLDAKWTEEPGRSGISKWEDLRQALTKGDKKKAAEGENIARDIIFQYCYPRLDDKVSIQINHLLKSPFCVHPKTHRVCVPIPMDSPEIFDPLTVPTLQSLSQELNEYNRRHMGDTERKLPDYEKTSLKPYMEIFKKFVNNLLLDVQREKRDTVSMEF